MSRTDRTAYLHDYWVRYRRPALGIRPLQPAGPVAAHIRTLLAAGMPMAYITQESGASDSTLRHILAHPDVQTRAAIADAILAVRPPASVIGLTRRVRALAALGWSTLEVARASGLNIDSVKAWRRGDVTQMKSAAPRILHAYAALSMTRPPAGRSATQVRNEAEREGWAPPLAWDDDIDDPNAQPQGAGWEPPSAIEECRELEALGLDRDEIARARGVSRAAIDRAYERAARREIAA